MTDYALPSLSIAFAAFFLLGLAGFLKDLVDRWDMALVAMRWKYWLHGAVLLVGAVLFTVAETLGWIITTALLAWPLGVNLNSWQFNAMLTVMCVPFVMSAIYLIKGLDRFGHWLYDKLGLRKEKEVSTTPT